LSINEYTGGSVKPSPGTSELMIQTRNMILISQKGIHGQCERNELNADIAPPQNVELKDMDNHHALRAR
jgi:hypothetical protein